MNGVLVCQQHLTQTKRRIGEPRAQRRVGERIQHCGIELGASPQFDPIGSRAIAG